MITLECSINKSILDCDIKQPYLLAPNTVNKNMLNEDLRNTIDDKVDKVTGKGLSSNDYDDDAKAAVDGLGYKSAANPSGYYISDILSDKISTQNLALRDMTVGQKLDFVNDTDFSKLTCNDGKTNLQSALDDKVDKEDGKGLSANDYTDTDKAAVEALGYKKSASYPNGFSIDDMEILTSLRAANGFVKNLTVGQKLNMFNGTDFSDISYGDETKVTLQSVLDNKVDKAMGKGLSSNDYTSAEKAEVTKIKDKADKTDVENDISDLKLKSIPSAEAEGYPITVTDQLADEEPIKLNIYGCKNLISYPYDGFGGAATKTVNGITFTDNGDGSITLNGTSTAEKYFEFMLNSDFINSIDKTKTYAMSVLGIDTTKIGFEVLLFLNSTWVENVRTTLKPTCDFSTYTKEFNKAKVALVIKQGASFDNFTVKPQLEIGTTATDYEPYQPLGDLDSTDEKYKIPVTVRGKNLIPYPYGETTKTTAGITFTDNGDGSVTVSGTPTGYADFSFSRTTPIVPNTKYTLSKNSNNTANIAFALNQLDENKAVIGTGVTIAVSAETYTFTAAENARYIHVALKRYLPDVECKGTVKPQLEIGEAATEYEPYKETQTITASLDTALKPDEYIDIIGKKRHNGNTVTDIATDGNLKMIDSGANTITCGTSAQPSKIEISYFQDINKVLTNLTNAILSQGGNI